MKSAFLFVFLFSMAVQSSEANTFKCQGNLVRNMGDTLPGKLNFHFRLYPQADGKVALRGLVGSFTLVDDTVKYKIDSAISDSKYKPVKYKNAIRFKEINSVDTSDTSALFGDLIIEKRKTRSGLTKAHYVFQGEQVGGTVDLNCDEEIN